MANREFLMLAQSKSGRHGVGGYWWSEKLDGMRAFWDGGITRGLMKVAVPFANHRKDKRYKVSPKATGLWSRYGNVIHAPSWWLDQLPKVPLDGELMFKQSIHRQDLMSIVKKLYPTDESWKDIEYNVFDSPPLKSIFADGKISNPNCKMRFEGLWNWYENHINEEFYVDWTAHMYAAYRKVYAKLGEVLKDSQVCRLIEQHELPMQTDKAEEILRQELDNVTSLGGEGLMVRSPNLPYETIRSHHLLKMKKLQDMEGKVIGYTTGRETDKGSKLLGLMGALIVRIDNNIILELSGFTDAEREFSSVEDTEWARENPGVEGPDLDNANFPIGSRVTFRYRGLTKDGVPQEARYWRKREDV